MLGRSILSFVVMVYLSNNVYGEIKATERDAIASVVQSYLQQCIEEFEITEEEIQDFKENENYEDIDPCFIGCFFKKTGQIDGDGNYDVKRDMEFNREFITDDDDRAKLDDIKKDCVKVNDVKVTDGAAGCERAALLIQCYMEHKFEIKIENAE